MLKDFFDACRYVRNHRGILICIALVFAVAFLANPMLQLAAVFTESVFGAGAAGLGLLTAAFGIGAVVATPFVTSFNDRFGSARLVGVSITWLAASVIAFGLSTELWQGALAMFATGMAYLVMIANAEHDRAAERRRERAWASARRLLHDLHSGLPARVIAAGLALAGVQPPGHGRDLGVRVARHRRRAVVPTVDVGRDGWPPPPRARPRTRYAVTSVGATRFVRIAASSSLSNPVNPLAAAMRPCVTM